MTLSSAPHSRALGRKGFVAEGRSEELGFAEGAEGETVGFADSRWRNFGMPLDTGCASVQQALKQFGGSSEAMLAFERAHVQNCQRCRKHAEGLKKSQAKIVPKKRQGAAW